MTPATPTPSAGSEFDEFLYAPLGEESNGTLLSMLSALARLNVDPWDEAARLGRLPREAATRFLTGIIAALPDGPSVRADPAALAERLIALLPQPVATNGHSTNPVPGVKVTTHRHALIAHLALYIAITVLFLGAQWLIGRSQETARSGAAASPTPSNVPHQH